MNDDTVPPTHAIVPAAIPDPPHPLMHWLKRLLGCNPFFPASALLLLYGVYRVSIDPNVFVTEVAQLTFNFTALQLYELLLVITAVVLARRFIWYDASLLVALENLFILVPFILISQAALIEQHVVWTLCGGAVVLAVLRADTVRRRLGELWPAPRFFGLGGMLLLVNGALPILYRHLHESKVGTKLAAGDAWAMDQLAWLVVLPALCALAILLPKPVSDGHPLTQRRWFPHAFFACWLLGTGVHLYCLGYVYDFDLSRHLLAPALWVLAWVCFRKLPDFASAPAWRVGAMALPLPMALVAAGATGSHVFAVLMLANALCYVGIHLRERGNHFALHLALLSGAAAVAGAPVEWMFPRFAGFERTKLIGVAIATYGVLACALSRNPKAAVIGGVLTSIGFGYLLESSVGGCWWAVQLGFGFFLVHSFRWNDAAHAGAALARYVVAGVWVVHSWFWASQGADWAGYFALPALILAVAIALRWLRGEWFTPALPVAALVAALCPPLNYAIERVQSLPVGVLAMLGSFTLLAFGTVAALTRHRWHPPAGPREHE